MIKEREREEGRKMSKSVGHEEELVSNGSKPNAEEAHLIQFSGRLELEQVVGWTAPIHDHLDGEHQVEQRGSCKAPEHEWVVNLLLRGEHASQTPKESAEHRKGRQGPSRVVLVVLDNLGSFRDQTDGNGTQLEERDCMVSEARNNVRTCGRRAEGMVE
jgi:hypothetical protein